MEDPQANQEESLDPTQVLAKATIQAECDKLAAAGVTFVAVHFDGSGDSGVTEEVQCYDSDDTSTTRLSRSSTTSRICNSISRHWFRSAMRMTVAGSVT